MKGGACTGAVTVCRQRRGEGPEPSRGYISGCELSGMGTHEPARSDTPSPLPPQLGSSSRNGPFRKSWKSRVRMRTEKPRGRRRRKVSPQKERSVCVCVREAKRKKEEGEPPEGEKCVCVCVCVFWIHKGRGLRAQDVWTLPI